MWSLTSKRLRCTSRAVLIVSSHQTKRTSSTKSATNRHGPPFFDHVVSATNGPAEFPWGSRQIVKSDVSRWRCDEPFDTQGQIPRLLSCLKRVTGNACEGHSLSS